jgi:hypothetical protein
MHKMHKTCSLCKGPFGLIRYRWWGEQFCSEKCRRAFLKKVVDERDRLRKWLGYLKPGQTHKQAKIT